MYQIKKIPLDPRGLTVSICIKSKHDHTYINQKIVTNLFFDFPASVDLCEIFVDQWTDISIDLRHKNYIRDA